MVIFSLFCYGSDSFLFLSLAPDSLLSQSSILFLQLRYFFLKLCELELSGSIVSFFELCKILRFLKVDQSCHFFSHFRSIEIRSDPILFYCELQLSFKLLILLGQILAPGDEIIKVSVAVVFFFFVLLIYYSLQDGIFLLEFFYSIFI